jgi:hypothetical protein
MQIILNYQINKDKKVKAGQIRPVLNLNNYGTYEKNYFLKIASIIIAKSIKNTNPTPAIKYCLKVTSFSILTVFV